MFCNNDYVNKMNLIFEGNQGTSSLSSFLSFQFQKSNTGDLLIAENINSDKMRETRETNLAMNNNYMKRIRFEPGINRFNNAAKKNSLKLKL